LVHDAWWGKEKILLSRSSSANPCAGGIFEFRIEGVGLVKRKVSKHQREKKRSWRWEEANLTGEGLENGERMRSRGGGGRPNQRNPNVEKKEKDNV